MSWRRSSAGARRRPPSTPSPRPAAPPTGTPPTCATARRWARRRRRSAPPANGSTCCSTPEAWRSAACCPTSRRPSSISSSTSRRTAGSTSSTASVTCRSGRRWCSARSPAASATAARPTTARPTTCSARACRRSARHGRRHVAIAIDWTAWAGIGMASRGSIPKMMALAGIDMLPPAIGIPVVRREITAGGTGGEVVVAGALGAMLDTAGITARTVVRAGAGPMVGQVEAADDDGLVVVDRARPGDPAVPGRPPHRRHSGPARRDGHRGLRRGRPPARPRLGGRRRSRTSSSSPRSSGIATSRAGWRCTFAPFRTATASSPTAGWTGAARCPANPSR